jgi:hypothetical protein
MANCSRAEFKPFIDWASRGSQGIVRHVIDVSVVEHPPAQLGPTTLFGTLAFLGAPLALPPLWLDDVLAGSVVDPSAPRVKVIVTIGLSNPVVQVWLRFTSGPRVLVTLRDLECTGGDALTMTGTGQEDGQKYALNLSKGTEIHIPTSIGGATHP